MRATSVSVWRTGRCIRHTQLRLQTSFCRTARHHALNELVARAFVSAGISVTKEPSGLSRSDGKRPDGMSLIPWQDGKPLCWDVTVICPLANSYTCSLQPPPLVLLPSWPPPARSRNTAHWKTSTSSSPLLWSLLAP